MLRCHVTSQYHIMMSQFHFNKLGISVDKMGECYIYTTNPIKCCKSETSGVGLILHNYNVKKPLKYS